MKIAVTYDNGQVFQHFGHTEFFKVYEAKDGKVVSAEVTDAEAEVATNFIKFWGALIFQRLLFLFSKNQFLRFF